MGPCMCGDTRCFSCGPAQGNYRCEVCGKWTDEGGCDNPEACNHAQETQERWDKYGVVLKEGIDNC